MSSIPLHMLGNMKASAPGGAGSSLNAVAATLGLRRKRPAMDVQAASDKTDKRGWKNPFSPPKGKHAHASQGESEDSEDGADARPPMARATTSVNVVHAHLHRDVSAPEATSLDSISLDAPPHVAVRYGDTIRLFARSKYATSDTGGYVGTFEAGRRFLPSKNPSKQGELACIPPVTSAGTPLYRSSSFTICSTCGIEAGAPVSYGDVVVLVDELGRVWNNKIGVGPTTRNGYFGPREQNAPGEMYLSFYQLNDDGDASSSDSESDDESDGFLSLSSLARTTKTMAETTFGKATQVEMDLAAAALRTMGRVVYYGDKNVIIDVADSNRLRSKFNRVVTHYRKNDELAVQGGYLRCDGRGKAIMFEIHGRPLATVHSIDVCNMAEHDGDDGHEGEEDGDDDDTQSPTLRVSSSGGSITIGSPVEIRDVRPTSVVSLFFSDGGLLKIPCTRFVEAQGQPFHRIVLGGHRPLRLQLLVTKSSRRDGSVSLKQTLRQTYRDLFKLYGGVVVTSSVVAFVLSKLLQLTISLPAMYMGGVTVLAVFLVELFFPGKVLKTHATSMTHDASDEEYNEYLGDWKLSILAIEASFTEKLECASSPRASLARARSVMALKVPKSFLFAENGNLLKATERYDATLAWRKEVNADAILSVPHTHYYSIKQHYHQFLHKTDKLGHPVYFEKIGSINMKQLQKLGISQDDLFQHYLFAMEFTLKYVANKICKCEACASSETHKLFLILDARGIGMKDVSGDGAEFIRRCTGIMQKHYPQRSYKIFFVNVPSWFGMAWKGIKPLLNETTRAKTNILSESDTPEGLLAHIDAENLPVEYGGTCSCPGGCEENSAFQQLQKSLVDSVISCRPFAPEEDLISKMDQHSVESAESELLRDSASSTGMSELSSTMTMAAAGVDESAFLPLGMFREEVVRAGFLLKRPMKHNNFTPIWNRRYFILHPDSLRFGKAPQSEVYQIVQLTAATIVRKTQKGNNTFEIVTQLMARNGHSLVLYAPSATVLNQWVDSIQQVIDKLAGKYPPASDAEGSVPLAASSGKQVD